MAKRSREDEFGGTPLPDFVCDPSLVDALEVRNLISLAFYVDGLVAQWQGSYRFSPRIVQECNRLAMNGIYSFAGEYRTRCVTAGDFVGAPHKDIPRLVEEMCDYANSCVDDPYHSAAYILWRTSWIHPFYDGNGRVSRELCYLAMSVGLGLAEMEGEYPIQILLKQNTERYMQGLRVADSTANDERPDVSKLESLLCELSDEQFCS